MMMKLLHPIAAMVGFCLICTFWISTVLAEAFGSLQFVIWVKTAIPWVFFLLIPALAITGATGLNAAKGRHSGLVGAKARRMPIIAANGLAVLIPAGLYLSLKADAHSFDAWFYGVQAIELVAGAVNISLMGLSMRDGLRVSGRLRRRANRQVG